MTRSNGEAPTVAGSTLAPGGTDVATQAAGRRGPGMLIVNADDLGRDKVATDAALFFHRNGRISSATAMVFMEDSARAAEQALSSGIDLGLHLDLSERFTGTGVPERLRECHNRICQFLGSSKYALLLYHPFLARQFRYAVEAQQAEFLRLYGREPSHIDGHLHMHLASNVLFQNLLPPGAKVRRSFSFEPGEKSRLNRVYRAAVDRRLARRHRLTDYFFGLSQNLQPERLGKVMQLAKTKMVELMTHPAIRAEHEFLGSDLYGQAVSQVRMAGYEEL